MQVAGPQRLPRRRREPVADGGEGPRPAPPPGWPCDSGRPVSVPDVTADERYTHLGEVYARFDVAGLVSLPLGPPVRPIGVLNAYFSKPPTPSTRTTSTCCRPTPGRRRPPWPGRSPSSRSAGRPCGWPTPTSSSPTSSRPISHELRTPLTSISGFVDTVLLQWDRLDDPTKRELLERTAWNASELRRLIDRCWRSPSLESAGGRVVELRPYDLAAGVADLVDHMAPALRDCPVSVDIEPGVHVLANTETVHHVVGNLAHQRRQVLARGFADRRRGTAGRVGLPAVGDRSRPGHRRRRTRSGSSTASTAARPPASTRGTGIGLAIVRASLEAVGGSVSVRSTVGAGARRSR